VAIVGEGDELTEFVFDFGLQFVGHVGVIPALRIDGSRRVGGEFDS